MILLQVHHRVYRAAFTQTLAPGLQLITSCLCSQRQLALTGFIVEVCCAWLEAMTMLCVVILEAWPYSQSAQDAMVYIELTVIIVKVGL